MPSADDQKLGWVQRVLGVEVGSRAPPRRGTAVRLAQARLAWMAARGAAYADLHKVERAILMAVDGMHLAEEVKVNMWRLYVAFEMLDTRLVDTLDEALNAADPIDRTRLQGTAQALVADHLAFIGKDPVLQEVDDNPFVTVAVAGPLRRALETLRQELG